MLSNVLRTVSVLSFAVIGTIGLAAGPAQADFSCPPTSACGGDMPTTPPAPAPVNPAPVAPAPAPVAPAPAPVVPAPDRKTSVGKECPV